MRNLIQKLWPTTSCSEEVQKIISAKDIPALIENILLGKVPMRITLMNDFFGQGDIVLNEARLCLEAAGGRVVIICTLESVDIQASQMTLATNAIKEAKRAASLS